MTDNRVPAFLCTLTNRLPENVHLIVASRDRFLPAEEILRLGGRLYTVGAEQLRLNHTELSIYAHRCGTELSDAQIESLLYSSEGWFSAIYLNLRTLHERGELPSRSSDIYAMFSAAMIDPLPSKRREFLAVMGLADEFTVEMAETVTGSKNTAAILQTLTEQNAFVKRLPDGVTFRFHHMMKDCAERTFHTMEPRRQAFTIIDMVSGTKRMGNICMRSNSTVLPKTTTRRCASSSATRASCSRRLACSRCSTSSPTARSKRSRSTRFRSSF